MSEQYKIKLEDLPASLRPLAELIGVEACITLSKYAGGTTLYVPKPEAIVREARNRSIRAEFTGANYRALARRYNLTESHIREIIANRDRDEQPVQDALW